MCQYCFQETVGNQIREKKLNFADGKDHFWKTKRVKGLINNSSF